ncbi:hypothetical protein Leryth_022290 [Lithospermum erythrorhizon]|uniref:DOG1 domain-containing protein n=1 Tax=Lithospermum erythrorhizon TaxID=34254 RepID=A0AAV3PNP6_LITER|nr:hypothetical protein Leryth_022290 [Lithospermum erythrorhizon]
MINANHSQTSSSSSSSYQQTRAHCCFEEWMKLQEKDHSELLQALTSSPDHDHVLDLDQNNKKEEQMRHLVEKGMNHFEKYVDKRSQLAQNDPPAYFGTTWCSTLELPLLWLSGCRPSIYVRLVYALCGIQFHSQLSGFLEGGTLKTGDLGDLSATQLRKVDELQRVTIRAEEKLSEKLASFQENIADAPIADIASWKTLCLCESNRDVDDALREHERNIIGVYAEADKFRLSTLRELLNILNPAQSVNFLAASKKLHLCIHNWGKQRDQSQGQEH